MATKPSDSTRDFSPPSPRAAVRSAGQSRGGMHHMRGLRIGVAIALVGTLAGGGGAYAAKQITSAQIKNNTITTKDIKDKSISTADMSAAAISSLQGKQGPAGPAGPAG